MVSDHGKRSLRYARKTREKTKTRTYKTKIKRRIKAQISKTSKRTANMPKYSECGWPGGMLGALEFVGY